MFEDGRRYLTVCQERCSSIIRPAGILKALSHTTDLPSTQTQNSLHDPLQPLPIAPQRSSSKGGILAAPFSLPYLPYGESFRAQWFAACLSIPHTDSDKQELVIQRRHKSRLSLYVTRVNGLWENTKTTKECSSCGLRGASGTLYLPGETGDQCEINPQAAARARSGCFSSV
ncbi:hypothetical protein Bbelb_424620 [Branchiostoma belcheri]|nr:hypothetical protein Bbelb_424620 [Branchiostoma belcheri]